MAGVSPKIERILQEVYGPVEAMFTVTQVPQGSAPEQIKERWLEVPLTIRQRNLGQVALGPTDYVDAVSVREVQNECPISVAGQDAVHALYEAGRWNASKFWVP